MIFIISYCFIPLSIREEFLSPNCLRIFCSYFLGEHLAPLYWLIYYVTWKTVIIATKELHLRTWASAQHIHSQKELLLSVLSLSNICFSSSRWWGISFIDQDHISQTVLWSPSRKKKKKSIWQYDCKTTNLFLIFQDNEMIISHLGKVYNMPFNNCIMRQWLISLCLLLQSLFITFKQSH